MARTRENIIWIIIAVIFILATVLIAAYFGRERPLHVDIPEIGEGGVQADLDIDKIREYVREISQRRSGITGYDGCEQTLGFLLSELKSLGLNDYELQEFEVAVPMVDYAVLIAQTPQGRVEIPIHPLWPNLARTCKTGPEGITGNLVDLGKGRDEDLDGKKLGTLCTQTINDLGDIIAGNFCDRPLDLHALHITQGNFRINLKGRNINGALAFLHRLDFNTRRTGRMQGFLGDGFIQAGLNCIINRFLLGLCTILLANNFHRHLARTKTRYLDATRKLFQPTLNRQLVGLGRNFNCYAALQAFTLFN